MPPCGWLLARRVPTRGDGLTDALALLRRLLPPNMLLWAGGAGLVKVRRAPAGVRVITDFVEAITALGDLVRMGQLQSSIPTNPH